MFEALPAKIGDLKILEQDGPVFITRIQEGTPKLALDENLQDKVFLAIHSVVGSIRSTYTAKMYCTPCHTIVQNLCTYYTTKIEAIL